MKHQDKYKDLDMKQKLQKVREDEKKSSFLADNVHQSKITKCGPVKLVFLW